MTESFREFRILEAYSTLQDLESIFVMPYKIDREKHDYKQKLIEILGKSVYNYQITLDDTQINDNDVQILIKEIKEIEVALKEDISKMPEDYEKQRGSVRQLLIKVKEVYTDFIDNDGLKQLGNIMLGALQDPEENSLEFNPAQHKLRAATNVCIYLYRSFYADFGYLIGPFIFTLLNLVNCMTS